MSSWVFCDGTPRSAFSLGVKRSWLKILRWMVMQGKYPIFNKVELQVVGVRRCKQVLLLRYLHTLQPKDMNDERIGSSDPLFLVIQITIGFFDVISSRLYDMHVGSLARSHLNPSLLHSLTSIAQLLLLDRVRPSFAHRPLQLYLFPHPFYCTGDQFAFRRSWHSTPSSKKATLLS